jgi:hypothetical protein
MMQEISYPDGSAIKARVTRPINYVERFFLADRGVDVIGGSHACHLIFPQKTQKRLLLSQSIELNGRIVKTMTSVSYVLPDASEVLYQQVASEDGVPRFETGIEIRSPDFERYRLLTSGRVLEEDQPLFEQAGVRFIDIPDYLTGGKIVVFPVGMTRYTAEPFYDMPDEDGPDTWLPGGFDRSQCLWLPTTPNLLCAFDETMARSAEDDDLLEYTSSLTICRKGDSDKPVTRT